MVQKNELKLNVDKRTIMEFKTKNIVNNKLGMGKNTTLNPKQPIKLLGDMLGNLWL